MTQNWWCFTPRPPCGLNKACCPLMLRVSESFSLSPLLYSVLWPGMKQCWPVNALLLPCNYQCQESYAPCGESRVDTDKTASVTPEMGQLTWFLQTADTYFIIGMRCSLIPKEKWVSKLLCKVICYRTEHTHTTNNVFILILCIASHRCWCLYFKQQTLPT